MSNYIKWVNNLKIPELYIQNLNLPENSPVFKSGYKYRSYTIGLTVVGSLYLDISSVASVVAVGVSVVAEGSAVFRSSTWDLKSALCTAKTMVDIPKATVAATRKHRSLWDRIQAKKVIVTAS